MCIRVKNDVILGVGGIENMSTKFLLLPFLYLMII
jgi:hypothetical protein